MITRMDRHIGRVFALLKDLNLDDDTLVVFTSDNGTTYTGGADAAFFRSVGDLRGFKGSVYEGGIRVPFTARWPGRIAAGQVTDHLSAMWDMLPTFLELARQPVPSDIDGLSLVPTLLGRAGQRQHASMYWEYHGLWNGAQAVRLGKWKGVRLGGHDNADAPIEVYDIDADRSESRNVAAAHPDVVGRVRAVMESRTPSVVPQWNFRQHAAIESQTIAIAGDGSPFYRIPALTTTSKGTLLAAYDARPTIADLPGALSIVMRRSTDGGRTWRPQTIVRRGPAPEGYGDPSFIVDRVTGRIVLFHAASVRQGFFGARPGNRDDDPDVLHADYAFSDDDVAASGEGIQLRAGPHAGRLIRPYVIRIDGRNWVASAYSDDHGERWQMGVLVGPDADESKAVELSDGRLMLTVRARPMRKVARSSDGGVTWTGLQDEPALPDPANNGSVMRVFPDAPTGSPEARHLLLTHTSHASRREHLVVRMSMDDGQTWSAPRVVEPGAASYSTATRCLTSAARDDPSTVIDRATFQNPHQYADGFRMSSSTAKWCSRTAR
jgi:sialidase-1